MMDRSPPEDSPRIDRWRPRWISQAAHFLMLAGAAGAVFVAGRVPEGHFGVFFLMAGVALLLCPPQVRVDWKLFGVAAALLIACSTALLPQAWFPVPEWRARLVGTAFPAIASVTPAPRETVFWLCVAAVAIAVALFALSHPLGSRGMLVLAVAAVLICGIYGGLAIFARKSGWEYPLARNPETFGFLPNRNHTATFLITGCMSALGVLGVAVRGRQWLLVLLAAAGLGVGVAALVFFSSSRGGVVFLLAGALLWFAGLGKAHRSAPLAISFGAILIAGLGLFLASRSAVLERMTHFAGQIRDRAPLSESQTPAPGGAAAPVELPLDGRVAIFHDTLRLIRDFPLTGTGLGAFRYTFRFYAKESLGFPPVVHPESDWLMLAGEAGIPAVIVFAFGLGWLLRRVWRQRDHPAWPLRWGILCAALAAILHGLVDAPAHRTALGWWILVLLVAGLQTSPREKFRRSRLQHLLFVAAGFGALALAVQLLRAEWFGGKPSPPYVGFIAEPEIIMLRLDGKPAEAAAIARHAIQDSPMTDVLYFQLGVALLEAAHFDRSGVAEAESALTTQRLLNPNPPEVPLEQGFLWLDIDPLKTIALWREAIERRARIDAARGETQGALALYGTLIRQIASKGDAQQSLFLRALEERPDFVIAWLEAATPPAVGLELPRLAGESAFLGKLSEPDRRRFLRIWYERGSRPALFEFIGNRPDWRTAAWPVQLRQLVDAGKFEEAVKAVAANQEISLDLPPPGAGDASPGAVDEANPAAAFDAYWRRGNVVAARRVLDEARRGPAGEDREILRLSAALAVSDGQWPAAWQHLDRWLRNSGLDSIR